MKNFLTSIAFVIISFAGAANVFATNIGSHSIDVTVGEVDKISADDENQDVHAPDTGLFGLEADGATITVTATIFTIIIFACVSGYIHRKHIK